ncbi:branched-chain amino acid ABC transporter permease [Salarchaeum sp. JOR-1]|uniref:branched-chain amino acid ABC transporter permease n=1 Tax=Salarchaeum sp. JOR-1 TaxID=2599399 RepID=UPI0011989886|nr:branched-chain amino acid ABC transporter permease [Salarchaeum sp. JOR-1]QDX41480.1 branched-chain amino acid ABC transporter permease [Salarchaeum sp. JOR-1]
MGIENNGQSAIERGVAFAKSGPGGALVVGFGAFLVVDLILKLAGVGASVSLATVPVVSAIPVVGDLSGGIGGAIPFGQFGSYVWNGVVIGLVIGLASIGLSLTYSILNFANFAHGDYLTAGAFSGWGVTYVVAGFGGLDLVNLVLLRAPPGDVGANLWLSPLAVVLGLVVSILATLVFALAIDRVVYRPIRDADGISLLIASIGVAFALRYLISLVFGNSRRIVTSTENLPSATIGGVIVNAHEVALIVIAVALMLGLHILLQRTKLGKAMRAMADNRDLARVTGIPTERVISTTWIIGAGLTGAAGFLLVLSQGGLGFTTGWRLLLLIFAAVIMGGIGSIYGAIAGGLVIGLASRVSLVWLQGDWSAFARPTAFLLMILILLFRPSGIFSGVKTT